MRYTIASIIFLLSCTPFLSAQEDIRPATISWGEELREPSGSAIDRIIAAGSWGSYVLRRKPGNSFSGEQIFIEQYDGNMKLKRSQKVDLRYKGKKREFEDLVYLDNELYLLTSFNNEAKKKNYLFAQVLNRQLQPRRDLTLIGEI
ncbi:MAG: hypothetical protein KDD15_31775, partial [Lewinella sp.]|nr:hypothetical protein [Lewinella sp.]